MRLIMVVLAAVVAAASFVLPTDNTNTARAAEANAPPEGYWLVDSSGGVFTFDRNFHGSLPEKVSRGELPADVDAAATVATPSGDGYWVLDEYGGVHTFGDARYFGSIPQLQKDGTVGDNVRPIDMAATPDGDGYWILDADGGVFTFGNTRFRGSVPELELGTEVTVTDIVLDPDGSGYWVVAEDGSVFAFGARFHGSIPSLEKERGFSHDIPVVGIAPTPSGEGYRLVDSDGGVFTFGDASYHGSLSALKAADRIPESVKIAGIAPSASGNGYLLFGTLGGVFTFGDARFHGSGVGVSGADIVSLAFAGYTASAGSEHARGVATPALSVPPVCDSLTERYTTHLEHRRANCAKIIRAFGEKGVRAARVARCESNFMARTANWTDPHGGSWGLFQINGVHLRTPDGIIAGHHYTELYDPDFNIRTAYRLSQGGTDWGPWACKHA